MAAGAAVRLTEAEPIRLTAVRPTASSRKDSRSPIGGRRRRGLVRRLGVRRALDAELPRGVTAGVRTDGGHDYVFVQNFTGGPVKLALDEREYVDMESGEVIAPGGKLELPVHGVRVLRRRA